MNKQKIIAKVLVTLAIFQCSLCPMTSLVYAEGNVPTPSPPSSVSIDGDVDVNLSRINEGLMTEGKNKEKGLNVYVQNFNKKGNLIVNRYICANNIGTTDYPIKTFNYDKTGADIHEVRGEHSQPISYKDTGNPELNYLIENKIISRDVSIHDENFVESKPLKQYTSRSDLIMALIKATYGVIEDRPQVLKVPMSGQQMRAEDYANRYLIKQDIFQDNLFVNPGMVYVYYVNPNNKSLYMDKACKLGLIQRKDLLDTYKPYSLGKSFIEVKSDEALKNEVIDYYTALTIIEKIVRSSEGYVDKKDVETLNFKYGAKISDDVPSEIVPTMKFLIAKGIVNPNESLTDRDFNIRDFAKLLYRVKNKSQRFSIKSISISENDKKLIDKGLEQTKIELISGFNGIKDVIPESNQVKLIGAKTKRTSISSFYIKDFFTEDVLDYMFNTLGMTDTESNRQLYADRFYITIQKYYKSNLLSDGRKHFSLKVTGNDLRLQIDDTDLMWLKSLARNNECSLELNSKASNDLPHFARFDTEPVQGTYTVVKTKDRDKLGVSLQRTGGLDVPRYRASADSALSEFIVTQNLYLAKDTGLDSFNYVTEEGEVVPLQTGIDKGKVSVTGDSKKPKATTEDGVVCYTVKFKVSAMTQTMAIKILQSKLSINKNKYTGYSAVDGYVDATKQNYYIGKSFLEYFGYISCLRDRVLYNRQTGTYCLLIDGMSSGSVTTSANKEFKTVICGNTIKRYPLDSPDLVFSSGGTVYYSLDAIQDLLGGKAFSRMGTSKTFFVDQLADEKLTNVYLNSNKPQFLQKDYSISYSGGRYLNMSNANFANDFVILDMFNIMRAKKKNLSVKLGDKRIGDQNLRMIVKWVWFVPSKDVQKINEKGGLTLTDVAKLLETPTTSGKAKPLCEMNKIITNRLLESAIGTEGTPHSYATSGYLVPQITLLSTKDTRACKREIDEVKNFLYMYVCKYATALCPNVIQGLKTDVERFDAFNKYMSSNYADKENSYLFFQTLCPKINRNIYNYGGYIMDNKGSVYQRITGDAPGFSVGHGIMYSGNGDKVYVSPFSKPSDLSSGLSTGNKYQYTGGNTYLYISSDNGKFSFIKNPEECDPVKPTSKFYQIKDITSWDLQKSISIEVLNKLRDYRKRDDLVRDNIPDLKPETTMDSNASAYTDTVPSMLDMTKLYKMGDLLLPQVIRTDEQLSDTTRTVLASSDYYKTFMKEGWVVGTSESDTRDYFTDSKGNVITTNVYAPKINLDIAKYSVRDLSNQKAVVEDNKMLSGTIVRFSDNEHFSNLSYKHPNFNLAEQWAITLMERETSRDNPFKDRVKFLKEIREQAQISFNGTDRFRIDDNGYIYTLDGKDISPNETTTVMLNDGTQVKSLQDFITKEGEHYKLSPTLKVLEISRDNTGERCYQLLTQQSGIEAFNLSVPFNVDLEVGLGKSYRFSYDKYDGEVPTNLTDIITKAIKYYNEQGNKSKMATIALEIIRLIFGLIIAMWCGFMLDRSSSTHRALDSIRSDTNIDFMKILTVGMCDLDTDVKLHKISVATLVFMFIQGLILVKYLGLPTF